MYEYLKRFSVPYIYFYEGGPNSIAKLDGGHGQILHDGSETLAANRPTRNRRLPSHLGDRCVTDTVGDRLQSDSKLGFQTNVYFVIDRLLNELERRFTAAHCDVLSGIQASNRLPVRHLQILVIFVSIC